MHKQLYNINGIKTFILLNIKQQYYSAQFYKKIQCKLYMLFQENTLYKIVIIMNYYYYYYNFFFIYIFLKKIFYN